MKTIISALLALSLLTGGAAFASSKNSSGSKSTAKRHSTGKHRSSANRTRTGKTRSNVPSN